MPGCQLAKTSETQVPASPAVEGGAGADTVSHRRPRGQFRTKRCGNLKEHCRELEQLKARTSGKLSRALKIEHIPGKGPAMNGPEVVGKGSRRLIETW